MAHKVDLPLACQIHPIFPIDYLNYYISLKDFL